MKIYLTKTNDYNCIIFAEGTEYIMRGCEPSGLFDGTIDIYADNAADQLRAYFQNLDNSGELNDFDEMPGDRQEIGHDLYEQLAGSEVIFSEGEGIQIWSVENCEDVADDIFCGTLEECLEYCQENGYVLGEGWQIARISVDDDFCHEMTEEIIDDEE